MFTKRLRRGRDGPTRLVHLQLLPLMSGVQKVTFDEFRELGGIAYERILICKEPGPLPDRLSAIGVDCHYIKQLNRSISPIKDFYALLRLIIIFRRLRPDIVHTHSSKTGFVGRIAARLAGVPVVVHTVHGFSFPAADSKFTRALYFFMEYIGGKACDALIVLGASDRNIALTQLKISPEKIHLVPNGVDVDLYSRSTNPARRNAVRSEVFSVEDQDTICIGMVGRLWKQKNPFCLLAAASIVIKASKHPVRFYFIGNGELREELQAAIDRQKIEASVKILGWRNDIPELLCALDLFVLPSLWEGMPLAILEAMAASLPVVASNIPGSSDLIEHDRDGLLFDAHNPGHLAALLCRLIADPQTRALFGSRARTKLVSQYSLSSRTRRIRDLYRRLLG